jgi:hypothetical protein
VNKRGLLFIFAPVLLLALSGRVEAAVAWGIDLGAYSENVEQWVFPRADRLSHGGEWSGSLRLRSRFLLADGWAFEPALSMLLPSRSTGWETGTVLTSFASLGFRVRLIPSLFLRFGPSMRLRWVHSTQGQVTLRNGTTDSRFFLPGGASTGLSFLVDSGLEFRLWESAYVGMDASFAQIASSDKRRVNLFAYWGVDL